VAEKLLLFGIGYVLGARAGRERLDEIVNQARQLAERDEVKMVLNMAMGFVEQRSAAMGRGERMRAA
jgi:hypothetical protein